MSQFLHILSFKVRAGLKLKFEAEWPTVIKNVGSLVVFGAFAFGAYFFAYNVVAYLIEDARIGHFLLHRFLSMFLFVFFITISLGNIVVAYSTLFKSPEVRFLFTTPVSFFKIFVIKFLDNFFHSSTTFLLMGFSVIVGYGAYFGHPWYFYPLVLVGVFIPFMFLAACVAVIILLMILRLTEYLSIKHIGAIFILGYVLVVYVFFQSISPISMVNNVLEQYPDIDRYFTGFDPWFLHYLPSHWVSELMYWSLQGSTHYVIQYSGLLLIAVGMVFGGAMVLGRKQYYAAWMLSMHLREDRSNKKHRRSIGAVDLHQSHAVPRPVSVVLKRDLIRFIREPSQWLHFMIMLVLVSVFVSSVASIETEFREPFLMSVVYLVIYLFNAFLIAAMALRFVYPMMSMEGEALWVMRSVPFSMRIVYTVRGGIALIILMSIAQVLTYVTMVSVFDHIPLLLFTMLNQLITVTTIVGFNLGLGSYFANYIEKNPIRIASSQGASLTFLITILYLVLVVSIFSPFIIGYFEQMLMFGTADAAWMVTPIVIFGLISALLFSVSTVLGVRAVQRDV
jgi:ABC-2 type transport system permease protein